jgi:hypothetical protein
VRVIKNGSFGLIHLYIPFLSRVIAGMRWHNRRISLLYIKPPESPRGLINQGI